MCDLPIGLGFRSGIGLSVALVSMVAFPRDLHLGLAVPFPCHPSLSRRSAPGRESSLVCMLMWGKGSPKVVVDQRDGQRCRESCGFESNYQDQKHLV